MIYEFNVLIYSVFIFLCYSFVILNMALSLFHTVKPYIISCLFSNHFAKILQRYEKTAVYRIFLRGKASMKLPGVML